MQTPFRSICRRVIASGLMTATLFVASGFPASSVFAQQAGSQPAAKRKSPGTNVTFSNKSSAEINQSAALGTAFAEGFDEVATLSDRGWFQRNNSDPLGDALWFQGNPNVFAAQAGAAANSYIGANFNSTTEVGTISNWLLTPTTTFNNGDQIKFYTRTATPEDGVFADRLEVRLSTNGASSNVGTTATDVGDFTTVLLTINPDLTETGYPTAWTQYTATISGLTAPTSGRAAFRYFVTNGGAEGDNSDYIGVDTFEYVPVPVAPPPAAKPYLDFFGSGRTSFATARASSDGGIVWDLRNNGGGQEQEIINFGLAASDSLVAGYFDADNKADVSVWRPGANNSQAVYYIRPSTAPTTFYGADWGLGSDRPGNEGDYDGDGKDDLTVIRNVNGNFVWYYLRSSNFTFSGLQFGSASSDIPLPGADYTGDGRHDLAIARIDAGGQITYIAGDSVTAALVQTQQWGNYNTDDIIVGDYIGDSRADFAVWRGFGSTANGGWYIKENGGSGSLNTVFGTPGAAAARDLAICGDYNGDGKNDIAVYRRSNNTFYWLNSPGATVSASQQSGLAGDIPIAAFRTR